MYINSKSLWILNFIFFIILDHLIMNLYLGFKIKKYYLKFKNLSFPIILLILFIFFLIFFYILNYFDLIFINYDLNLDLFNLMNDENNQTDKNIPSTNINNKVETEVGKAEITVNHPRFNLKSSVKDISTMSAAASSAGGAAVALKAAQQAPLSPPGKLALGIGIYSGIQLGTVLTAKGLQKNNSETVKGDSSTKNLIQDLTNNNKDSDLKNLSNDNFIVNIFKDSRLDEKFTDFPLNCLSELYGLVNLELLFLLIIFNTIIANYLINIDFKKYMPDNKFFRFLNYFIQRYIKLWSNSKKYILIISWIMIFYCVILSKLGFYFIINN